MPLPASHGPPGELSAFRHPYEGGDWGNVPDKSLNWLDSRLRGKDADLSGGSSGHLSPVRTVRASPKFKRPVESIRGRWRHQSSNPRTAAELPGVTKVQESCRVGSAGGVTKVQIRAAHIAVGASPRFRRSAAWEPAGGSRVVLSVGLAGGRGRYGAERDVGVGGRTGTATTTRLRAAGLLWQLRAGSIDKVPATCSDSARPHLWAAGVEGE